MQVTPVTMAHAALDAQRALISPSQVSLAALQRATGDGDGRVGVQALNDGDAAAHAAAQQVRLIDVRA